MVSKTKDGNAKKKKSAAAKQTPKLVYTNEEVKDFAYADYVKLQSSPRGMLFSFGKQHPEGNEFRLFQEIILPLDIAFKLYRIMHEQFESFKEHRIIEVVEEDGQEP